jgi:hypothetical protein
MGCVVGPGENPLRPGEIAIRVNACMECGKNIPMKDWFDPNIMGIDAWSPEQGDFIQWGVLCSKHESMATHTWGEA